MGESRTLQLARSTEQATTVSTSWLARMFGTPFFCLSVSGSALSIRGDSEFRSIPYEEIAEVVLAPGILWNSLSVVTSKGKVHQFRRLPKGTSQRFLDLLGQSRTRRWTTWLERQHTAILQAEEAFQALLDGPGYASDSMYRRWRDSIGFPTDLLEHAKSSGAASALSRSLSRIDSALRTGRTEIDRRNAAFVESELASAQPLLDRLSDHPLTPSQRRAIVCDEDSNLVLAGAGTGKTSTLTARAAYLVERGIAREDQILLLAFANKARDEIAERLADERYSGLRVSTFHSLGRSIIQAVEQRPPSLAPWANDQAAKAKFLREIIQEVVRSPNLASLLARFFIEHLSRYRSIFECRTLGEYIRYLRTIERRTLQGEVVRSYEEARIANFLYVNGISYEYEAPYEHDVSDPDHAQYKPDFFLRRERIYLEHFGIDRDGNTAPWIDREEYASGIRWKRETHQRYGTRLIETYSYEQQEGALLSGLETKLRNAGVEFNPIPPAEVFAAFNEAGQVSRFQSLVATFLSHFKNSHATEGRLRDSAELTKDEDRSRAFVDVFVEIYKRYQAALDSSGQIDFEDMIARATRYVQTDAYTPRFTHILVDEFQDISRGRFALLRALQDKGPAPTLFCVGDDWQAIYRFAGGDVSIMTGFSDFFEKTTRTTLDRTFRFNNKIADVSSSFVEKNPKQLRKQLTPHSVQTEPAIVVVQEATASEEPSDDGLTWALSDIAERSAGDSASVLVLGRRRKDRPALLQAPRRLGSLSIEFQTVHASKGRQSDFVVVTGLAARKFPSSLEDDPLLDLVMPAPEKFAFAEERRLFYVALTRAKRRVYLLSSAIGRSVFVHELIQGDYDVQVEELGDAAQSQICPNCLDAPILERTGPYGVFHACGNFPLCSYTAPKCNACGYFLHPVGGAAFRCASPGCAAFVRRCPDCQRGLLVERNGRFGPFWGCSRYSRGCRFTESKR